jgi:hypothetical protein
MLLSIWCYPWDPSLSCCLGLFFSIAIPRQKECRLDIFGIYSFNIRELPDYKSAHHNTDIYYQKLPN